MLLSIRSRLLLTLMPAAIGIWLLSAVTSYFDTRNQVENLLDSQLETSGKILLGLSLHELKEDRLFNAQRTQSLEDTITQDLWEHDQENQKKIAFQVWINRTKLALRSNNAPTEVMTRNHEGFSNVIFDNKAWRVYSAHAGEGEIRVHIGEELSIRENITQTIVIKTLGPLFLSLPILALVLWFGISYGMTPLSKIAREIISRRPSELSPLTDDIVPKEAKPLTDAINHLFARLKAAFDSERRFTADAAHELRTPMAALKTHAELALQARDDEHRQHALRQIVRGVNRATHLVEQLLTLARLDPDTGLAKARRFDLFIVAENVISDEAPIAIEREIEISLTGTRGKFIFGNYDAIAVLTRNLVDNAIRYTPEGGEVEVNIGREENKIILSVADSGPGIPEEERDRVFQRFYRQLGTKSPGSGLGLSIVSRIADLHQLKVVLLTSKLGGLQVDVYFDACDDS